MKNCKRLECKEQTNNPFYCSVLCQRKDLHRIAVKPRTGAENGFYGKKHSEKTKEQLRKKNIEYRQKYGVKKWAFVGKNEQTLLDSLVAENGKRIGNNVFPCRRVYEWLFHGGKCLEF